MVSSGRDSMMNFVSEENGIRSIAKCEKTDASNLNR